MFFFNIVNGEAVVQYSIDVAEDTWPFLLVTQLFLFVPHWAQSYACSWQHVRSGSHYFALVLVRNCFILELLKGWGVCTCLQFGPSWEGVYYNSIIFVNCLLFSCLPRMPCEVCYRIIPAIVHLAFTVPTSLLYHQRSKVAIIIMVPYARFFPSTSLW